MRRSTPLRRPSAPERTFEDRLYLYEIEVEDGLAVTCLAICSLALDAFDAINHQNRLLLCKLRSDSCSENTLDRERLLRLALDTWQNEAFPAAGGRPGESAHMAPSNIAVIQDGQGQCDFFWCDDDDLEFGAVFSPQPGVPSRSAAALALLFPVETARAETIFREFFGDMSFGAAV